LWWAASSIPRVWWAARSTSACRFRTGLKDGGHRWDKRRRLDMGSRCLSGLLSRLDMGQVHQRAPQQQQPPALAPLRSAETVARRKDPGLQLPTMAFLAQTSWLISMCCFMTSCGSRDTAHQPTSPPAHAKHQHTGPSKLCHSSQLQLGCFAWGTTCHRTEDAQIEEVGRVVARIARVGWPCLSP